MRGSWCSPGVHPHLASKALALTTRRLTADRRAIYGHPVVLAETFVDPARFAGTAYRAAGWQAVGAPRGFARAHRHYRYEHLKDEHRVGDVRALDSKSLRGSAHGDTDRPVRVLAALVHRTGQILRTPRPTRLRNFRTCSTRWTGRAVWSP